MSGPWPARLAQMVDGDSVILDVDLGWDVSIDARCRLNGIDAPERHTPAGKEATRILAGLLTARPLMVSHVGRDRYGRWLVDIACDGYPSVADEMVRSGHARRWT